MFSPCVGVVERLCFAVRFYPACFFYAAQRVHKQVLSTFFAEAYNKVVRRIFFDLTSVCFAFYTHSPSLVANETISYKSINRGGL